MLIKLLSINKTNQSQLMELISDYEKRLKHYVRFEHHILELGKKSKNNAADIVMEKEAELVLNTINKNDFLVLLDERGQEFTSKGFANFLQKKFNSGSKEIVFVIGGAYGFSNTLYKRANAKIAISQMTFTHQMVRLIFIEQLYRAMTIIKGEKYHH